TDVYVVNQAPTTATTSLIPNLGYSVDYTLRKATDNTLLDQGTLPYIHSTNSVIRGFYVGMLFMRVGGRGYIGVPSSMGYGATGSSNKIAPYTPLIFEITRISQ
ncbi:MAG: FKBP-type peptidyl-prolyl cis-trans isomerase, partial [Thermoflexibacteraceae bacterium]